MPSISTTRVSIKSSRGPVSDAPQKGQGDTAAPNPPAVAVAPVKAAPVKQQQPQTALSQKPAAARASTLHQHERTTIRSLVERGVSLLKVRRYAQRLKATATVGQIYSEHIAEVPPRYHSDLIVRLVKDGYDVRDGYAVRLSKLRDLNTAVARAFFETGRAYKITIIGIESFREDSHREILALQVAAGEDPGWLSHYKNLDHSSALLLAQAGKGDLVLKHSHAFGGLPLPPEVGLELIKTGYGYEVARARKDFALDDAGLQALARAGYSERLKGSPEQATERPQLQAVYQAEFEVLSRERGELRRGYEAFVEASKRCTEEAAQRATEGEHAVPIGLSSLELGELGERWLSQRTALVSEIRRRDSEIARLSNGERLPVSDPSWVAQCSERAIEVERLLVERDELRRQAEAFPLKELKDSLISALKRELHLGPEESESTLQGEAEKQLSSLRGPLSWLSSRNGMRAHAIVEAQTRLELARLARQAYYSELYCDRLEKVDSPPTNNPRAWLEEAIERNSRRLDQTLSEASHGFPLLAQAGLLRPDSVPQVIEELAKLRDENGCSWESWRAHQANWRGGQAEFLKNTPDVVRELGILREFHQDFPGAAAPEVYKLYRDSELRDLLREFRTDLHPDNQNIISNGFRLLAQAGLLRPDSVPQVIEELAKLRDENGCSWESWRAHQANWRGGQAEFLKNTPDVVRELGILREFHQDFPGAAAPEVYKLYRDSELRDLLREFRTDLHPDNQNIISNGFRLLAQAGLLRPDSVPQVIEELAKLRDENGCSWKSWHAHEANWRGGQAEFLKNTPDVARELGILREFHRDFPGTVAPELYAIYRRVVEASRDDLREALCTFFHEELPDLQRNEQRKKDNKRIIERGFPLLERAGLLRVDTIDSVLKELASRDDLREALCTFFHEELPDLQRNEQRKKDNKRIIERGFPLLERAGLLRVDTIDSVLKELRHLCAANCCTDDAWRAHQANWRGGQAEFLKNTPDVARELGILREFHRDFPGTVAPELYAIYRRVVEASRDDLREALCTFFHEELPDLQRNEQRKKDNKRIIERGFPLLERAGLLRVDTIDSVLKELRHLCAANCCTDDAWRAHEANWKGGEADFLKGSPDAVKELQALRKFNAEFPNQGAPILFEVYRALGDPAQQDVLTSHGFSSDSTQARSQLRKRCEDFRNKILTSEGEVSVETPLDMEMLQAVIGADSREMYHKIQEFNKACQARQIAQLDPRFSDKLITVDTIDMAAVASFLFSESATTKFNQFREALVEVSTKDLRTVVFEEKETALKALARKEAEATSYLDRLSPEKRGPAQKEIERVVSTMNQIEAASDAGEFLSALCNYSKKDNQYTGPSIRRLAFRLALDEVSNQQELFQTLGEGPSKAGLEALVELVAHNVKEQAIKPLKLDKQVTSAILACTSPKAFEEDLDRLGKQGSKGKETILVHPTRGILGELSGYNCGACWTRESDIMKRYPNATALMFVRRPEEPRDKKLVGACILLKVKDMEGSDVFVVRGLNPTQNFITQLKAESFFEQFIDHAIVPYAHAQGVRKIVIPFDGTGSAMTNRPSIASYVCEHYGNGKTPFVPFDPNGPNSTFNQYEIANGCVLVRLIREKEVE